MQNMNKALLIIDIQNDYFPGGKMPLVDADKATENAKQILAHFRDHQLPIIHIQHISTRPSATFFLPGSVGIEIHDAVKPISGEIVIVKHYPNSFRETELLSHLQSENITDLVICGMMTQHCVDSTTRAAKDYGFNCIVIGDACATRDLVLNGQAILSAQVQLSFLAALNFFFASVHNTQQWLNEN